MNNWKLHGDLPGITVGGVGNRFSDFEGLGFWGSEIGPKSAKIGPNGPSRTVIGFLGGYIPPKSSVKMAKIQKCVLR